MRWLDARLCTQVQHWVKTPKILHVTQFKVWFGNVTSQRTESLLTSASLSEYLLVEFTNKTRFEVRLKVCCSR